MSLRHVAERLSRNVITRSRLPDRFGRRRIYLSPGNHLAVLKFGDAKFEAYLLGFVDRFITPDSVVWDIGANMGIFAFPAAHVARHTLGFEPDPFNLRLLQRTREANRDLNVEFLPVALADSVGSSRLNIPERGRSANSLEQVNYGTQMGGVRGSMAVITMTADWMLDHFPAPTFIKCDAEGAELMILQGATRLLAETRPAIVIEMPNENAPACAAIFRANDYALFRAYDPVDPAAEITAIDDVWEVLAIPREKLGAYTGR